jgi:hypothetical protein
MGFELDIIIAQISRVCHSEADITSAEESHKIATRSLVSRVLGILGMTPL